MTRCPLELALRNAEHESADLSYSFIKGDAVTARTEKGIKYEDITAEVDKATCQIAGDGKPSLLHVA